MRLAIGHGVEGGADLLASGDTEPAEPPREHGFRYCSEVVEGGDAVVVDSLIDSDGDAGDRSDGAGHGSDDDVVEYWDDFIVGPSRSG